MKNFFTNFYQQVKNSIYGPGFYKDLENQDFSYSAKYLLKLSFLISLLSTIVLLTIFFVLRLNFLANSGIQNMSEFGQKYVETYFPNDLVINFENGILSTNINEPVIFPIPTELKDLKFRNFIAISPNENISRDSFQKYDSFAVLASTTGAAYDESKNSINFFNYIEEGKNFGDMQNLSINKNFAIEKVNLATNYLTKILPFIFVALVISYFIFAGLLIFLGALIFALFTALLACVIGRIWGIEKEYGVWYSKAVHADTLYILLAWTIGFIVPFTIIPFANTILVLLVLFFNDNFKK